MCRIFYIFILLPIFLISQIEKEVPLGSEKAPSYVKNQYDHVIVSGEFSEKLKSRNGKMFLYDPTTSSMQTRMEYQFVTIADRNTGYTDESVTFLTGASAQSDPLATNFIRFFPNSGTFEGGVIRCYGIVDS